MLTSIFLFIISNKIFGAYIYNIVVKKIRAIRVLFLQASLCFFLIRKGSHIKRHFPFYHTFQKLFQSISSLAEDSFWITLSNKLISLYQHDLQQMHHTLFSDGSVFLQFQALFHSPITLIVVLLGNALVMRSPVRWIPTEKIKTKAQSIFGIYFIGTFKYCIKFRVCCLDKMC